MGVPETGDAWVYAKDVGTVVIWVKHQPKYTVTVDPPEGISWHEYTGKVVTPALAALGWRLNNWHRPSGNQSVYATAFIWRAE